MVNETLLEINNLIVSFENPQGELTAVKGVSLSLAKGETLALVGESGCGKTVLCKSMLRILCERGHIRQGEILLQERNIAAIGEREMQRYRGGEIAMVFQDPMTSLDPAFSVGEQIAEVLRLHKGLSKADAKMQALDLMELVQIQDAGHRYGQRPYQFSGGMRQRIAIAIALAAEPTILLADEPTTALDDETQQDILKLLKDVQKKMGTAILFITHDLSLVEEIADRVAIMQDGRLVEEGKVSEVFAAPKDAYTRKLLGYLDYKKGRGHHHRSIGSGIETAASDSRDSSMGMMPLLSVQNLCKSFPAGGHRRHVVLEGFTMEIFPGEIVGLVGKSGSGKSTLARCIAGLEKPDEGTINIADGTRLQMIFQDSPFAFNDRMTVEKIIAEPLQIGGRKARRNRNRREMGKNWRAMVAGMCGSKEAFATSASMEDAVFAAMKAVELEPSLAERKPYELSGGQRQRVAIARALIAKPDLIIADEPLTGLDVSAQAQIVHLFKKLAIERGLTILFIAHDLPMVNHISDRIIDLCTVPAGKEA